MPNAPTRHCRRHGYYRGGRCPSCDRERQASRPTAAARGYGREWQRESKAFLALNPWCRICEEERGLKTKADLVDHIKPHRGDMGLFWERNNWQPLCRPCHDRKSAKQDGWFGNRGGGGGQKN